MRRLAFEAFFDSSIFNSLSERVLVLNRCFLPIHITNVRRAVNLLYLNAAQGIDPEYRTYAWEELELLPHDSDEYKEHFLFVRAVSSIVAVPKVIVLNEFDKIPKRQVRFSRTHVFLRDQYRCQYCVKEFPKSKLNVDHVLPRSRGGRTTWDNIVTSCHRCNRKKGNKTPTEAGMPLHTKPKRPQGAVGLLQPRATQKSWTPFLISL